MTHMSTMFSITFIYVYCGFTYYYAVSEIIRDIMWYFQRLPYPKNNRFS